MILVRRLLVGMQTNLKFMGTSL